MTGARSFRHDRRRLARLLTGGLPRPPRRELLAKRATTRIHPLLWFARQIVGWCILVVGIIGIVMPLNPALIVIPAGIAIIGRRNPLIRRCRVAGKLTLRTLAERPGAVGRVGARLRGAERRIAKLLRDRRLAAWTRTPPPPAIC